jgi:uncharacterized protein YciI
MKYFAAMQTIRDASQIEPNKAAHVEFLERLVGEGKIALRGRFTDGSGGLTIFQAQTLEEARAIAESDPYVTAGARHLELREWAMKPSVEEYLAAGPRGREKRDD